MLVLGRKENETIHIGENITVTVLSVRGGVVKLGINAPNNVRILRGELAQFAPAPRTEMPIPPLETTPHTAIAALAV
jgi:carbon storage regulator